MKLTSQHPKLSQIVAALAACLGCLSVGAVLAYTSSAIPSMRGAANSTDTSSFPVSDEEASWIGSVLPIGALIGSLSASALLTLLGRKNSMLWVCAPTFIVSWGIIAASQNVYMVYAGRLLGGIVVGLAMTAAPLYVVETADVTLRGTLGAVPQLMLTLGILLSYVCGSFLNWIWLAVTGIVFVGPYILLLTIAPESPQWLLQRNKKYEAREVLVSLRGNGDVADGEIKEMQEMIGNKDQPTGLSVLNQKPILKAFLISLTLMLCQQLSGVNAVIFYTVQIFQDAGSDMDPNLCTIIVGIVQIIATGVSVALVEKLGRKPLLAVSSILMCLSVSALGTYFYLKENYQVDGLSWLPLVSLMVYICAFSLGFGPLPWLICAELLPPSARIAINPLAVAANWTCVFIVTKTFSDLSYALQPYGVFWLYGGVCLLACVFSMLFVPETKGKSAEEIQAYFQGSRIRRQNDY